MHFYFKKIQIFRNVPPELTHQLSDDVRLVLMADDNLNVLRRASVLHALIIAIKEGKKPKRVS